MEAQERKEIQSAARAELKKHGLSGAGASLEGLVTAVLAATAPAPVATAPKAAGRCSAARSRSP